MSTILQHLLRPLLVIFLIDVFSLGYGQKQFLPGPGDDIWNDGRANSWSLGGLQGFSKELILDVWLEESGRNIEIGSLGLRFVPEVDQNVYLLYNYELAQNRSKAEIGFSVNNFTALTLKYSHSFSIQHLTR